MYAILQQGGHQYRVSPGDRLVVDQLDASVGSVVALAPVLLVEPDGGSATVGTPALDGVRVAATVVGHRLGRKLRIFKYKPKKRYRRTRGHRSRLTELRIESVVAAGEPLPEPAVAAPVPEPAPEAAPPATAATRRRAASRAAAATPAADEEVAEVDAGESPERSEAPAAAPRPRRARPAQAADPAPGPSGPSAPRAARRPRTRHAGGSPAEET